MMFIGFAISWGICTLAPMMGIQEFVGIPTISWQVTLATVLILGTIGLVAGYFPARAAANSNPVEALRL